MDHIPLDHSLIDIVHVNKFVIKENRIDTILRSLTCVMKRISFGGGFIIPLCFFNLMLNFAHVDMSLTTAEDGVVALTPLTQLPFCSP